MKINVTTPIFGQAYDVGWIGFTRSAGIGDLIAYGERFELDGLPSVNHALVVTGPGQCVQAHIDNGVEPGELAPYLNDPKGKVFFRKPLFWSIELGAAIAASAQAKIGAHYAKLLIAEDALADTLAGHAVNALFHDWPHFFLDGVLEKIEPGQFICSMLAAYALAEQPCYKGVPLFKNPLSSIDPQALFVLGPFEDVANDCSCQAVAGDKGGKGNDCEND